MELALLLAKYDSVLQHHLNKVINVSEQRRKNNPKSRGRGTLNTFLSKTTVGYILTSIRHIMLQIICEEINSAGIFSVQIDCTQDITSVDQAAVVVRYVHDNVCERLISVSAVHSSTGKSLYDLLMNIFESRGISCEKCISDSTDGAANMSGDYNGLTAFFKKASPDHLHVWCYAHVLNLVMSDITECTTASISFFGLLNSAANFFKESYQRMDQWVSQLQHLQVGGDKIKRLQQIGATRWWAKDKALKRIYGHFDDSTKSLFVQLLFSLNSIAQSTSFNSTTRFQAESLVSNFLKFENILLAQLYLRIFQETTPLSEYLQTNGMDFVKAYTLVRSTTKQLQNLKRSFCSIQEAANRFVKQINSTLEDNDSEFRVQSELTVVRPKKKKRMISELAEHEDIPDSLKKFEVEVYNVILDQAFQSISSRFTGHEKMYADFACLDPRNFSTVSLTVGVADNCMEALDKLLTKRFPTYEGVGQLRNELVAFASQWHSLKRSISDTYNLYGGRELSDFELMDFEDNNHESDSDSDQNEESQVSASCKSCKNCAVCVYQLLRKYNLYSRAYSNLFLAYKFAITLSISQVTCERRFSKLQLVKSKTRNLISQDFLETAMLMYTERDILDKVDFDKVIDLVAQNSKELTALLIM